jgi:hypothetical protein
MDNPTVLGRDKDGSHEHADPRASTTKEAEVTVPFHGGANGTAKVELFSSDDNEDRGGIVMRLRIVDGDCAFVPTARIFSDGVELHVAGEAEGAAILRAIIGVIAASRISSTWACSPGAMARRHETGT